MSASGRAGTSAIATGTGLVVLLAVLSFGPAAIPPLFEPDEGRYAEIGREMLRSGDWLEPRFYGVPHLAKPPFAYWMAALGTAIWSPSIFGARFFPACASFLTVLLVSRLGRKLYGGPVGILAGLMYATAALPFTLGHGLGADVFVAFWQVAGVVAAVEAFSRDPAAARPWRLSFWACFGMAFFTKGPPGLLALVPIMAAGWARRRAGRPGVLWSWPGFILFLALGLWWFVAMVLRDGNRADYFLVDEGWNRVFTGIHGRNNSPLLYAAALTLGFLPWTAAWLPLLGAARHWWLSGRPAVTEGRRLLLWWLLSSPTVFLLAQSRLVMYVAPLFVPLSILAAEVVLRHPSGRMPLIARRAPALVGWCVVLVAGHAAVRLAHTGLDLQRGAEAIRNDASGRAPALWNATGTPAGSISYLAGLLTRTARIDRTGLLAGDVDTLDHGDGPGDGPRYLVVRRADEASLPPSLGELREVFLGSTVAVYRIESK